MKKLLFILLAISGISSAQIADKAEDISPLLIGEKIPKQDLVSVDSKFVSTTEIFNKKTVLIVYRGGWCPYCNSQLSDMQEIEKQIIDLGYQIVAVSPDAPKFLKQTQFYSHVIHLVSKVVGKVKQAFHPFELLFGTFPAGTLSGAPKYKALQLIDRYEPEAREFYGGCIGFISHDNQLNHAIMIRTFLSKDNTLHFQAGAGIVISSDEEKELQEINHKVSALKKAIQQAEKINNHAMA